MPPVQVLPCFDSAKLGLDHRPAASSHPPVKTAAGPEKSGQVVYITGLSEQVHTFTPERWPPAAVSIHSQLSKELCPHETLFPRPIL